MRLDLGAQAHAEAAARMREFILAMQAIWRCWETGEKLNFEGEFYQHNLMTPMFVPGKKDFGAPEVYLAAVGPLMTETAAEVASGMIAHGFTTARYLQEVTLPAVEKGLAKAGRSRSNFDICSPIMVVSGATPEAFEQSLAAVKSQLAFYASTPAYRPVLELHGWGELQGEMNQLTREGKWTEMADKVSDDMLEAFAIVAEDPADIPALLHNRYGGLVDTWQCTYESGDDEQQK